MVNARRVALYGGSFDPPHNGHVLLATWVLCRAQILPGRAAGDNTEGAGGTIDELWLLPAAGHAFGKNLTPFSTRCALLEAAFSHLGPKVRIEPIEHTLPTPSYTVDTLRALTARHPDIDFTLIMGSDSYLTRHKWKAWDELEALLGGRVLVIGREGSELTDISQTTSSPSAVVPSITLPDFSSTAVRAAVKEGTPYWWMVPDGVEHLIRDHGLYR